MINHSQNQGTTTCSPAPTSPATAAARRSGQVAEGVYETRRARLKLLIKERTGGSQRAFAKQLNYTRSNIHHFLSTTYNHGRSMGERAARKLEHKAGLPYGWLDQVVEAAMSAPEANDVDALFSSLGRMSASVDCPICGIPADLTRVPKTSDEAIAFVSAHYNCQYDGDKPENVRFDLSVHDLLSAFRDWFDVDPGAREAKAVRDARETATIWDHAKADAAMYVEAHCVDGEMHAKHIMEQPRPKITPALPKAGIKAAEITELQRDLARLAAGDDSGVAAACIRAQAVIEGLLSGLDMEQLA